MTGNKNESLERQLWLWKAKLAAWLHDPPEKALILARTEEGHEQGTAALLRELCFGDEQLSDELQHIVEQADRWAAASDRPQWPVDKSDWRTDEILFWSRGGAKLIHPLAGDHYDLGDMYVTSSGRLVLASSAEVVRLFAAALEDEDPYRRASVEETQTLFPDPELFQAVEASEEALKSEHEAVRVLRKAVVALWRWGPLADPQDLDKTEKLGEVWRLLPADSRVPDHSIWEHNGLASAFAGALAWEKEGSPALLLVTLGPVQSFIEEARTTSDLWAASHLLSVMAWEAMKPVVERFGPDAVVFPSLWGVPLVDAWLVEQGWLTLNRERFQPLWKQRWDDTNPLFAPSLPNRFIAIVPAAEAATLGQEITRRVREWVRQEAKATAKYLLGLIGEASFADSAGVEQQISEQLEGFPEVYWASVAFLPLVRRTSAAEGEWDPSPLRELLESFWGKESAQFFASAFWENLRKFLKTADSEVPTVFRLRYHLNPGTFYPAFRDVAEKTVSAVKACRAFGQVRQEGYRCSLCGEREWLRGPQDSEVPPQEEGKRRPRRRFEMPPGSRGDTLWGLLAADEVAPKRGFPLKPGEHLCVLCALKRLWPRRFVEKAQAWVGGQRLLKRFVVSTHAMALAPDLAKLPGILRGLEAGEEGRERLKAYYQLLDKVKQAEKEVEEGGLWTVLPRKLVVQLKDHSEGESFARTVPALFDYAKEEGSEPGAPAALDRQELERLWRKVFGQRPETYYGLILMDGDQLGKWISGDAEVALKLKELWHPQLVSTLVEKSFVHSAETKKLLDCERPASPAYHVALSAAMGNFAQEVARWVVEELFMGKLIYSGGDDALALVTVDDLIPCMFALRCAFSGIVPTGEKESVWELYRQLGGELGNINRGYVKIRERLLRVLGGRMTASMGAVVAHHEAPLQAVLRRLRRAEQEAKNNGRNSFSIALVKRGGGETTFTASWGFGGIAKNGEAPEAYRDLPYNPQRWAAQAGHAFSTPIGVLLRLRDTLALPFVSRRAVYRSLEWLDGVPAFPELSEAFIPREEYRQLLIENLAWQFQRQGVDEERFKKNGYEAWVSQGQAPARRLAEAMVDVALRQCAGTQKATKRTTVPDFLRNMLLVAEFLAREGRAPQLPEPIKGGER
ncbi:MAG: type III-B CRISPR-associated protein Cas10/Cmr2 [Thermoanaerobaculum sp.]|nr:type III-B CRISPR-associated protein Cas10/Cmr2 [Thermoanaerobaculum sp.]MDW7966701.1 type III-B CRISPR-associated protein Cas10/Cmr2 [Thermoanaerobaculum sp.]